MTDPRAFKWTAGRIVRAIGRQLLERKCLLVVDGCYFAGSEADVLGVTMDRRMIDVEVKISRADLKADARKDKWYDGEWTLVDGRHVMVRKSRTHPRRIWKHYYCTPAEVWKPELEAALPSTRSGIVLLHQRAGHITVQVLRKATPDRDATRITDQDVLTLARLTSLRLWDAYADAERLADDRARTTA